MAQGGDAPHHPSDPGGQPNNQTPNVQSKPDRLATSPPALEKQADALLEAIGHALQHGLTSRERRAVADLTELLRSLVVNDPNPE